MNRRAFINLMLAGGACAVAPAAILTLPTFEDELARYCYKDIINFEMSEPLTVEEFRAYMIEAATETDGPTHLVMSRVQADRLGVDYAVE